MHKTYLTVGELANKMNVTVRTLQYYDKIGLVKASAYSEGGRRLYSDQDVIILHQVLALKYLGFSLDEIKEMLVSLGTPEEVATVLQGQSEAIAKQIEKLKRAKQDLEALCTEVLKIREVDFAKYADIIATLRSGDKHYWMWKQFDRNLAHHVRDNFSDDSPKATEIINTYSTLLDRALYLIKENENHTSKASQDLAEEWWVMVTEFTGGDLSLLPHLIDFNSKKENWEVTIAQKQKKADSFLEKALSHYFQSQGLILSEEDKRGGQK